MDGGLQTLVTVIRKVRSNMTIENELNALTVIIAHMKANSGQFVMSQEEPGAFAVTYNFWNKNDKEIVFGSDGRDLGAVLENVADDLRENPNGDKIVAL